MHPSQFALVTHLSVDNCNNNMMKFCVLILAMNLSYLVIIGNITELVNMLKNKSTCV